MIQGTASHVGKSALTAGFCRLFARLGYRVAPFKAQNMALNSFVTLDGREIGRSTAFQARAAGVEPVAEMNPVLLKPSSETGAQVVLLGKPVSQMEVREYHDYQRIALPVVEDALLRLRQQFDLVILEGAGSPAEINLMDRDIVNMKAAEMADAPVLLVGDIERGGVFASLYGTLALLPPASRERVKGLIINKFRGDESLLDSGIDFLNRECGCPVLGVLHYLKDLAIEEEDSLSLDDPLRSRSEGDRDVAVIRLPHISNFTDFDPLARETGIHLRYVSAPSEWSVGALDPDLVIVPGTKSTVDDLRWLREAGLADRLIRHATNGGKVIGICGGYQMLGRTIVDEGAVESRSRQSAGLGLLEVDTVFRPEKTLRQVQATGRAGWTEGAEISGYEIHHGETNAPSPRPLISTAAGFADGTIDDSGLICGTYIHGLFDTASCRQSLRRWLGLSPAGRSAADNGLGDIDRLATTIETKLDMEQVLTIIGI
jgi:adenosylcobyric acid synthase